MMLMKGSVNSKAPSLGNRPANSATTTMTVTEMITLISVPITIFSLVIPVRFFFEVTGVGYAIDDARNRPGVLLDNIETLVIANET